MSREDLEPMSLATDHIENIMMSVLMKTLRAAYDSGQDIIGYAVMVRLEDGSIIVADGEKIGDEE